MKASIVANSDGVVAGNVFGVTLAEISISSRVVNRLIREIRFMAKWRQQLANLWEEKADCSDKNPEIIR